VCYVLGMSIRLSSALSVAATLAVGAALVGACSSSTAGGTTTTGDGGGDASPSSEDASRDAAQDIDAAPGDHVGAVFAISDSETSDGGTKGRYRAGGFFARTISPDSTTITKTVGPCVLEKVGDGEQANEEAASAGALHLEGGKKAIDIAPKGDRSYAAVTGAESLWSGGETLTVRADGKDVPAFNASLKAPSKISLGVPATTNGGDLTITRSAGVTATWTGASSGVVVLYFDVATSTNAFTATCTFDVAAGTATIPGGAFADFPAGDGTFDFYVKESVVVTPPGWYVRFTASSAIVDGNGAALAGRATFK